METYEVFRGSYDEELVDWLYALPTQAELDGILYVHGSPLSDVESFPPQPSDDDERMLAGVRDRTVVFGHSHQQFRRPGAERDRRSSIRAAPECRSTATCAARGRPGTATSNSAGPSTTSLARPRATARWAASSASSRPGRIERGSD